MTLHAGSIEREVFDNLMLDRELRKKLSPQELEGLIERILKTANDSSLKEELENEVADLQSMIDELKEALSLIRRVVEDVS